MAAENFEEKINILEKEAKKAIGQMPDLARLEKIRVKYLGRKGEFNNLIKELPRMSEELKVYVGRRLNSVRNDLSELFNKKGREFKSKAIKENLEKESIDVTMPAKGLSLGHLHPLTKVERRIENIFQSLGFSVVFGPEIESEYYNFDALNIPKNHPARDIQDTFWLRQKAPNPKSQISNSKNRLLLRTHTSPMQARYMEKNNPPLRIIVPGRVYRYEATDASHEIQFHQIEGLMVDESISLANLKAVFEEFFKKFFNKRKVEIRIRPGYFPFVEPGIEVDIKLGSNSEWLEVAGAGMVHPKVFKAAGYIPGQWQGFAFGLGLDRLAMLYYGINDIRLFYSSDFRFLRQF
ncbi:MAG: phenylalanine--tRNA ligase subunit alpha [Candidatus Azambacteria bacterium]|nr:phenylalanine--tRNA ligase subunit alpha [Candidatus Azambacteria bacterium]